MSVFDLSRAAAPLASLLTQDCALCGARNGRAVCAACAADLPRLGPATCPVCAIESEGGATCGDCLRDPPHFDAAVAVYRYAFPLDRLVQSFKFSAQLSLVECLSQPLAQAAAGASSDVDVVVPVPLSRQRLATRGFDQAALIGRVVARAHRLRFDAGALSKVRDTPPQSGLDRERRLKNVRGAYQVGGTVAGLHVALVDDVMTTGATLSEAARMLKRAGVRRVSAWVVARAGRDVDPGAVPF